MFLKANFIHLSKPFLHSRFTRDTNNLKTWSLGLERFTLGLKKLSLPNPKVYRPVEHGKPVSLSAPPKPGAGPQQRLPMPDFKRQCGVPGAWPTFSVGAVSEQLTLMRALQCACGPCEATATAVQDRLRTLNLNLLDEALLQKNPSHTDALAWQVVWLLALTPTGLMSLSAWQETSGGSGFAVTEASCQRLQSLARLLQQCGGLQRGMKPPSQLFPSLQQSLKSSSALMHTALEELLGGQEGWAGNAVKNGLFSQAGASDFDVINKRLEKVSCWANRAQKPYGLSRLFDFWHKSPFHEFKTPLPFKGPLLTRRKTRVENKLHQVLQGFESSSRLRLTNGHCLGLSTGFASLIVTQMVTGLLLRFRLILKLTATRQALFEMNMGPKRLEITVGVRNTRGTELGASAGVGPDTPVLSAGATTSVHPFRRERGQITGVCLHIPRYPQGDAFVRQRAQALVSLLTTERPAGATPVLTEILQRFPEVSVSLLDRAAEQRHSCAADIELSAGLGFSHVRALGHLTFYAEREWSRSERAFNSTGLLRSHKQRTRAGSEVGIAAQIRLGSRENLTQAQSLALSPGTLAGVSMDLGSEAVQVRREIFKQDGAFSSKSFFEVEYIHRADFERAQALLQQVGAVSPALKPLPLQLEKPAGARLSYAQRHELKPEVRLWLNQLESLRVLLSVPGYAAPASGEALASVIKTQEHELQNPENYRLTSLRCYSKTDVRSRFGLNLAGVLETTSASQSTVLLSTTSC